MEKVADRKVQYLVALSGESIKLSIIIKYIGTYLHFPIRLHPSIILKSNKPTTSVPDDG